MLYKVLKSPDSSIVDPEDMGAIRNTYGVFVFRYNVNKKELHCLMQVEKKLWAFVKVDPLINENVKKKILNKKLDGTKAAYDSPKDAIIETFKKPEYSVFGCTNLKEMLHILKEYGI